MALIVQKYGGSSIETTERIKRVAERIMKTCLTGHDVVVVASAMGNTTDELIELAGQVSQLPLSGRELDMLLTSGERISNALLAIALNDLGCAACSLSGDQAGVLTTSTHGKARIVEVLPTRVRTELNQGRVVLVAGFQGVACDTNDTTTLGRGGSDTTAVALAAALAADVCEIYTDVDGVCTADPRIVPDARLLDRVSYEEMLELSAHGARVLVPRCVEYARRHEVVVHVRSSFSTRSGTVVAGSKKDPAMEQPVITGIAHDYSVAKVVVTGIPNRTEHIARLFRVLAEAQMELDLVTQSISPGKRERTDVAFTLPSCDAAVTVATLRERRTEIGFDHVSYDEHVGTVSLIGAGMRAHPSVAATFYEALAKAGISIELMSTSEIRTSVVCKDTEVDNAVRVLHSAFTLSSRKPAMTYAETDDWHDRMPFYTHPPLRVNGSVS